MQCVAYNLFFRAQRANVSYERMNLILAERTLERRHSALTVGNDLGELCIGHLLDFRGAKVRNVHALSDRGAASIRTVAHGALCPERRAAGGAVWTWICLHYRDYKERQASKQRQQNRRGERYMAFCFNLCHGFSFTQFLLTSTAHVSRSSRA